MTSDNLLSHTIAPELLDFFKIQARQKIESERWIGRNKEVKIQNFVYCWTTEEAFKQLLIKQKIWFRNRGLYFGDAQGAGADFTIKVDGKEVTVGLRSVAPDSIYKWKSVAYPDDRIRDEADKIADYHVVCHSDDGKVSFFGAISKQNMLDKLQTSRRLYSKNNQEYFRILPIDNFTPELLSELLEKADRA